MRYCVLTRVYIIICCSCIFACHRPQKNQAPHRAVYIDTNNGAYSFFRNGKPFLVKGGSGFTHLSELKQAGGNTLRVWDTVHLKAVLDSAHAHRLAVIVGIPMPPNLNMDDYYNDTVKVNIGRKRILAFVNKFKGHPALLSWCIGNELTFPFKPRFNRFYTAFNAIVDGIHREDPDHPVTTTIMTFKQKDIINIKLRTSIDFISFNIFGSIQTLASDLDGLAWFWKGPFLITEWGVEGPWVTQKQNAWGAYIENTSDKKAEEYLQTYQKYMPKNNPRFLGAMVFYWGQKQECTPTWFSLFDENGNKTEAVNVMQYIWTGKQAANHAPPIKYPLLNGRGAKDNILLKADTLATGKVYFTGADTANLTYKWQLLPEDWFKPAGIFSAKKPVGIPNFIGGNTAAQVRFKAPKKEGPYRLLVYVYNKQGYVATGNTPFYVLNKP